MRHVAVAVRVRRVSRHLSAAWAFWLAITGFAAATVLFWTVGAAWAGALLEVAGLITVAEGLRRVRRTFKRPGFIAASKQWLRELPEAFGKPEPITIRSEPAKARFVVPEPTVIQRAGPGLPLDVRVETLEAEVERIRQRHQGDLDTVEQRFGRLNADLAEERADRAALKQVLEDFAVGGLQLEAVGVAWLVVGVLLATLPMF